VKVPEFNNLFSQILLSDSGDKIIHIRGNHLVSKIDATAMQIFRKDGTSFKLTAGKFIDKLIRPTSMESTSPTYKWMNKIGKFTDQSIAVVNAEGRTREIVFADLKFSR
jgi:hypothetical protein